MSAIREAAEALAEGLRTVEGVIVYTDPSATVDPPGIVVGPPRLTYEAYVQGATTAAFRVVAVVAQTEDSLPALWDLVPQIDAAIETVTDAVVTLAAPGQWGEGTSTLPCYEFTVEMSL